MRKPIKIEAELVGIEHGQWYYNRRQIDPVKEVFKDFKKKFGARMKPGRTLFIEHPWSQMGEYSSGNLPDTSGYERIVAHALKKGMTVVALDTPSLERLSDQRVAKRGEFHDFWWKMLKLGKTEVGALDAVGARNYYIMVELREKRWASRLRQAKKGDLIVMHPDHAWRIAPRLGIAREDVAFLHRPSSGWLAHREEYIAPEKVAEIRRLWREHLREELAKKKAENKT